MNNKDNYREQILVATFLAMVIVLAWAALDQIEQQTRTDIGRSLQTVLHTTEKALNLWEDQRTLETIDEARSREVINETLELLALPREKETLLASQVLADIRTIFQPKMEQFGDLGIFIIAPDRINIASMRDENIGIINLIAEQRPDLLDRVFDGETLLIPTIRSDVPLPDSSGELIEGYPTMFVAAPIRDSNDEIIAVLTIRIDLAQDFGRIIQLGRFGESRETYAFDSEGESIVLETRNEEQLRQAGLIQADKYGIGTIRITDPGGNLLKGFQPALPAEELPLTVMAASATAGESGLNTEGYRDYRGVEVFGAWIWDDELDFGLATEVDVSEAMRSYNQTRTMVIMIVSATVASSMFLLLNLLRVRRSSIFELQQANVLLEKRVKKRTAELSLSKASLERAQQIAHLGSWEWNAITDQLTWSDEMYRILGLDPETYGAIKLSDFFTSVHPNDSGKLREDIKKSIRESQSVSSEYRIIRADGVVRAIHSEGTSQFDKQGKLIGRFGTAQDITERKQVEEELRKKETSLAQAQHIARVGSWERNSKSGEIIWSDEMYNIYGLDRATVEDDLTQDYIFGLTHSDDVAKVKNNRKQTLIGLRTPSIDYRIIRPDGHERVITVESMWMRDEIGEPTRLLGVTQDITERKEAEKQRLKLDMEEERVNVLEGFIAGASHDLKTPLTTIQLSLYMLQNIDDKEKQLSYLNILQEQTARLTALLEDMLNMSRLDGIIELSLEPADLNMVTENVIVAQQSLISQKKHKVVTDFGTGMPKYQVDMFNIHRAITAIIVNALNYTADNGTITFKTYQQEQQAVIEITDNGIGISDNDLPHIFDRFYRADEARSPQTGGTGLGLAIAKKIIEMHQGKIEVESKLGQGSTFRIILPIDGGN